MLISLDLYSSFFHDLFKRWNALAWRRTKLAPKGKLMWFRITSHQTLQNLSGSHAKFDVSCKIINPSRHSTMHITSLFSTATNVPREREMVNRKENEKSTIGDGFTSINGQLAHWHDWWDWWVLKSRQHFHLFSSSTAPLPNRQCELARGFLQNNLDRPSSFFL